MWIGSQFEINEKKSHMEIAYLLFLIVPLSLCFVGTRGGPVWWAGSWLNNQAQRLLMGTDATLGCVRVWGVTFLCYDTGLFLGQTLSNLFPSST